MSDLSFRFEEYGTKADDHYAQLRPDQARGEERARIAWKIGPQPQGTGAVLVALGPDERALGMLALEPRQISRPGEAPIEAWQPVDTIVAPEARGKGLFVRMGKALYEMQDRPAFFGFPNAAAARGWFARLDWTDYGQVPMQVRALRAGLVTRRLGLARIDFALPVGRPRGSSRPFDRFDTRHEAAWAAMAATTPDRFAALRSAAALGHRFDDHPTVRYDKVERDGAFLVTRLREAHGAKILYIMEAVGPGPVVADMLLEACRTGRDQGAEMALAWGYRDGALGEAFSGARFLPFPPRLRPVEINFGALFFDRETPPTADSWFLSYFDSDTV